MCSSNAIYAEKMVGLRPFLCSLGGLAAGIGITVTLFPLELLEVNKVSRYEISGVKWTDGTIQTSDVFILMCVSA
jgi:hypothetical protein